MANGTAKNVFSRGMVGDITPERQPSDSYRYALNGRIRFNTSGSYVSKDLNSKIDGRTGEFCTERGNIEVLGLCSGYYIVGVADFNEFSILLSKNGTNSEIGKLTINEKTLLVEYTTLFNDKFDPNGDLLRFGDSIRSISVSENDSIRRVYIGGDENEPRVIDLSCFYKNDLPIHNQGCNNNTQSYPKYMSVHNMNSKCDVYFGRLKYCQTIEGKIQDVNYPIGSLKTGVYQYLYRYRTKSGYVTSWFIPTNGINLTGSYYKSNIDGSTIKNHHKYVMYESGLTTQKSIELVLEDVDDRFYEVEFAYIYSTTSKLPIEFNIFEKVKIISKNNITIVHRTHGGVYAGDISEINRIEDVVKKVQEVSSLNNKLLYGGVEYLEGISVNTSHIKIKPIFRDSICDIKGTVTFTDEDDVITNTEPIEHSVDVRDFLDKNGVPVLNKYKKITEYINYKGTRFEHLFTSYWRNEVYPFYLVGINRKGYHSFAIHIDDYRFPEQFNNIDNTGIDARLSISSGIVRVMGAVFDGINIPKRLLFDEYGNFNIVGFAICRGDRKKRILHQGVLLNCVHTPSNDDSVTDDDSTLGKNVIRAMNFIENQFTDTFLPDFENHYGYITAPMHIGYPSLPNPILPSNIDGKHHFYMNKAGWFTLNSPDVSVDSGTLEYKKGDYVELAGSVYDRNKKPIHLYGGQFHLYTKSYLSDYKEKREKYKDKNGQNRSSVRGMFNLNNTGHGFNQSFESVDIYDVKKRFDAYVDFIMSAPGVDNKSIFRGWAAPYTSILLLNDWDAIDLGDSDNPLRYHLVNYCRTNEEYFTDLNTAKRTCYSTGHYQPINNNVLSKLNIVKIDGEDCYQFNGIEVWGGDCYPYLYDFVRIYPNYGDCSPNYIAGSKCKTDYAISMIVPIETNYNMMLSHGRKFAEVATQPESTGCGCSALVDGALEHFRRGIMEQQPEDWNYNEVLSFKEQIKLFTTKPTDYIEKLTASNRWIISNQKTYEELIDSYRRFSVNDFYDVDSQYGKIVGAVILFDYLISFQENAYGALDISPTTLIPSEDGIDISLGKGSILNKRYISREYGCQHRDSIVVLHRAAYFPDINKRKIIRYSQAGTQEISDMFYFHDFMFHISPEFDLSFQKEGLGFRLFGIADIVNNEYILNFFKEGEDRNGFSIYFAEDLNCITQIRQDVSVYAFRHKNFMFESGINNRSKVYISYHGKYGHFFGNYRETVLCFVVNQNSDLHKTFEAMAINCNEEAKYRISLVNFRTEIYENQSINIQDEFSSEDGYARYRESRLVFPTRVIRDESKNIIYDSERVKGNWMMVTITIDNALQAIDGKNIGVCINSILTDYRDNYKKIV